MQSKPSKSTKGVHLHSQTVSTTLSLSLTALTDANCHRLPLSNPPQTHWYTNRCKPFQFYCMLMYSYIHILVPSMHLNDRRVMIT